MSLAVPPLPRCAFVQNSGQWPPIVVAASRQAGVGVSVGIGRVEITSAATGQSVSLTAPGPLDAWSARLVDRAEGQVNFLTGQDPGSWHTRIATYESVEMSCVSTGERWRISPRLDGPGLDFLTSAGARPWLALGSATLSTASEICHAVMGESDAPVGGWERRFVIGRVAGAQASDGEASLGFSVDWSVFVTGSLVEDMADVCITDDGFVVGTGETSSLDFLTTPGSFLPSKPSAAHDAFVMKFELATGTLVYSTLLGGSSVDRGHLVAPAPGGAAIVKGQAGIGFPVTVGAFDTGWDPSEEFIARLSSDGAGLEWSTYFGGTLELTQTRILAVSADTTGRVFLGGHSNWSGLPTTPGAFQSALAEPGQSSSDGFLIRLAADGSQVEVGTFFGGTGPGGFGPNGDDEIESIATASDGSLIVVGRTSSVDLPTSQGAFDSTFAGQQDTFVARFSADGTQLIASSLLGGVLEDHGLGIASGVDDEFVIVGHTRSLDFPTTAGAFQEASPTARFNIAKDGFLSVLSADAKELVYSTYIGSFGHDRCSGVRVDPSGVVSLSGLTTGTDFLTTPGAWNESPVGADGLTGTDGFAMRFHPDLATLLYSSYVGGNDSEGVVEVPLGMDTGPYGELAMCFRSASWLAPGMQQGPIPPPKPPTTPLDSPQSGLLCVVTMLPAGVARFGESQPQSAAPISLGVLAVPSVGNDSFGITTSNAPPSALGLLGLALDFEPAGVPVAGFSLWLDPTQLVLLAPVTSDAHGWSERQLRIPDNPAVQGVVAYAQTFWVATLQPKQWAASNALRITVQPRTP